MADKDKQLKIKKSGSGSESDDMVTDQQENTSNAEVKDSTGSALKIKRPADDKNDAEVKDSTGSALKIKRPADSKQKALKIKSSSESVAKTAAPAPGQASQAQPRPIADPTKTEAPKPNAPAPGQASQAQPRPIADPTKTEVPKPNAPAPGQASQAQPKPIADPTKTEAPKPNTAEPAAESAKTQESAPEPANQIQPTIKSPRPQSAPQAPLQPQLQPPKATQQPQINNIPAPPAPQAFPTAGVQPKPAGKPPAPSQQAPPVFPTQKAPTPSYESPVNNGPVFPINTPNATNAGRPPTAGPPGTLSPAARGKSTSPPLSAIMGEVKAAKKINVVPKKADEVIKVKKPSGAIADSRGNEFCIVPKDKYYIGIDNELEELEAAFALARFPVTKKEYFEFINDKNIDYTSEQLNEINKVSPYPNCPAVMVSWNDAKLYCRWLRQKTGEYYALPTAKEWECAARGKDGRIYPWGEGEPNSNLCCFNDQVLEPQTTCSVDYFQNNVSPFGCVGMIGNVMEWTLDSFDDDRDPHILKGGSWVSTVDFCNNITPCMSYPPTKRQEFVGLRLLYLPKDLYMKYKEAHS